MFHRRRPADLREEGPALVGYTKTIGAVMKKKQAGHNGRFVYSFICVYTSIKNNYKKLKRK